MKIEFLSRHSVRGPCLHMIFAPPSVLVPSHPPPPPPAKWLSLKPEKSIHVQVMAMGDMKSQSLTKIQIFVLLSHDFQTTTSIKRSNFAFSCIIQPTFSENEKKKYFNNVLDTYIFLQSSNFIHRVTFSPKKGQHSGPNILVTSWNFGEKNYQVPNVII